MNSESEQIFQLLYGTPEIEDEADAALQHQLDTDPQSFLHVTNTNSRPNLFGSENSCQCNKNNATKTILIPQIPHRCFMNWPVGVKLAAGNGAVVFMVDCLDPKKTGNCTKVARITQLRDNIDRRNFRRDVQARYILACTCPTPPITALVDAFICTVDKHEIYGVTISDRYDGTPVQHVLSLSSDMTRQSFVQSLEKRLLNIVARMHECGIVHRDLHQGNILVRASSKPSVPILALTDFEGAGGRYFNTNEQQFEAYVHSDQNAVKEIVSEMETVRMYLNHEVEKIDEYLLEDLGITLEDLNVRAGRSRVSSESYTAPDTLLSLSECTAGCGCGSQLTEPN